MLTPLQMQVYTEECVRLSTDSQQSHWKKRKSYFLFFMIKCDSFKIIVEITNYKSRNKSRANYSNIFVVIFTIIFKPSHLSHKKLQKLEYYLYSFCFHCTNTTNYLVIIKNHSNLTINEQKYEHQQVSTASHIRTHHRSRIFFHPHPHLRLQSALYNVLVKQMAL